MKKANLFRGLAAIMAFFMFASVSASVVMFNNAGMINQALNLTTSMVVNGGNVSDTNTTYYANEYGDDVTNKQTALMVEMAAAAENVSQAEEGTVLLKNDNNALPLAADSRITVFGNGSYNSRYNKKKESSTVDAIPMMTFNSSMQKVLGEDNVNLTLAENIYVNLSQTTNTEIIEAPLSDILPYESSWQNDYHDAAVVVLTRWGSEDGETAMYNEDGTHYLGLSSNEADLLRYLQGLKGSTFDKIIAVINADQMMELDWLDEYGVDACVLAGIPGTQGFEGVANVMVGNVNPSGRTVDTYAANSLSAPATVYASANTSAWGNADEVNATCTDNNGDGAQIDYYTICAEGIYIGYKYYETRYEDCVLGSGSADSAVGSSTGSAWNYDDEMVFPFGYGLSYTTFDQVLKGVTYNQESDNYEVEVEVTNTGDVAGKSVVEVYAQTPYGDYEKQNLVEKSAIQVVGFEKTDVLEVGESVALTVPVERYMLASYDSKGAAGYILSAGDYYLAVGDNAHDALNNVLAAKGYSTADGMDADGNADKTYKWTLDALDSESYRMSRFTEAGAEAVEVTNQFDFADLNNLGVSFTYLTRNDWEGTYPDASLVINATEAMMRDLDTDWYEQPADAPAVSDFTQGAATTLMFADMKDIPWNDDETWNTFLDQFTVDDMLTLVVDSNGSGAVEKVTMPATARGDDGVCIQQGSLSATGESAMSWVSEVITARTWSKDCFTARGHMLGVEASFCELNELWYGGGNIHRTPFGGRNMQYYSEDANFGYFVGAYEAAAMQEVGVNYGIKHFVMNDQEAHRESLSTFATEQAIRESYLRSFEGAFCEGGALGVMTGFNRIGCQYVATCENLLTNVLKGEWGFKGHVTTDAFTATSLYKTHYLEELAAGIDYTCWDTENIATAVKAAIDGGDGYILQCLRLTAKHNVYAAVNSVAVNGLSSDTYVVTITPWWETAILAVAGVSAVLTVGFTAAYIVMTVKSRKHAVIEEAK